MKKSQTTAINAFSLFLYGKTYVLLTYSFFFHVAGYWKSSNKTPKSIDIH